MKITIAVTQFPPRHVGGTELQAKKMAWQLAERDNLVHIVMQHDEGLPCEEKVSESLFIHRKYKEVGIPVEFTIFY